MRRDTVLFAAGGRPPCDSALELAFQVAELAPNLRLVWLGPGSESHLLNLPPFVYAPPRSGSHALELTRSRLMISTHGTSGARRLPLMKTPILQTFHAIPIKRLGNRNLRSNAVRRPQPTRWNFVLSPSEFYETEVIEALSWSGTRIRVPLPRYSLTQRVQRVDSRLRLRRILGLDPSTKIVMFAPTYRASHDLGSFDPLSSHQLLARLLRDEYFILTRDHYLALAHNEDPEVSMGKELSAEDSLLVLSGCDVLVTDYSSLMVDAAFLDIPTVLLTPDIDLYERSPGLTISIRQSAPGILTSCVASAAELVMEQTSKGFSPEFRQLLLAAAGLPDDPLVRLASPFDRDSDLAALLAV